MGDDAEIKLKQDVYDGLAKHPESAWLGAHLALCVRDRPPHQFSCVLLYTTPPIVTVFASSTVNGIGPAVGPLPPIIPYGPFKSLAATPSGRQAVSTLNVICDPEIV